MKVWRSLLGVLLCVTFICGFSACNLIAKKTTQTTTTTTTGGGGDQQPAQGNIDMTGDWTIAFLFGDQNMKSTLRLQQQGTEFSGDGADAETGRPFQVQEGTIQPDGSVFFKKVYPNAGPNVPAVEYAGLVKMVNDPDYKGPWMSGEFTTVVNGNPVKGQWEGQKMTEQAPPQTAGAPEQPAPEPGSDHPPDLSGKWNVGYEFNFKTIKSTMFLEQDGGKLTGHGVDNNTKEKFTVEKGWYNFPKVTLIRHYIKGKGAASERKMTFKAQVSMVKDPDYQGPYMSGKTEGGGDWEAQLVK